MRISFYKLFICLSVLLMSIEAFGQITVKGTIYDDTGVVLPGVTVMVKGTKIGSSSNVDGVYSISAKEGETLVFIYLGMKTLEVSVKSAAMDITMQPDLSVLNEAVVVGYGVQKRTDITGSISSVSSRDILKAPAMNLSNVVSQRVSGVAAVQSSGQPGADYASLTMRGQSGIIYVIDGIRRTFEDFNSIDPNEIESVSVLKDASAVAVYGLDANGAFIVTTKSGGAGATKISYTGSVGISHNAEQQQWLDGPEYAYWYNKARVLDGNSQVFSPEVIAKMKAQVDGWGNTNWYKELFGMGYRTHHNISASGGTNKVKYFASIGILDENGNLKGYDFTRYNIRTNVEAKVSQNVTFQIGISERVEERDSPLYSANPGDWHNVPQQIIRALPYVPMRIEKDGTIYNVATPTNSSPVAPLAALEESGYRKSRTSYFSTNAFLRYDAPFLKGLSVKFQGSYDACYYFGKSVTIPYKVMLLSLPTAETTHLNYTISDAGSGNTVTVQESAQNWYVISSQSSINYENTFNKHSVKFLALAETRQKVAHNIGATGYGLDFIDLDELSSVTHTTGSGSVKNPVISGSSSESRVAGFVARLNYNYAEKYFFEGSVRYDGSYLFGGMNKRWVTLPGFSLGWRPSQESWFNVSWIDNLKVRGGIGMTGTSGISPFMWRNTMAIMQSQVIIGGAPQSMIYASTLGNPNLSWAKCLSYNIGIDATLFNGLLDVEADVFYKYEYDKLSGATGAYPPSMGGYYFTTANGNECDYKGYDLTITHINRIGDFMYSAKVIWSYAYGRWLKYMSDADNVADYQRITGKQIGSQYCFIAEGLWQSDEEIENSVNKPDSKCIPGYVRYKDVNGDGIISYSQDQGYFGKSATPTHTGSMNLYGSWKGLDLDLLFSWGLGGVVSLTGVYTTAASAGIQDNTAYTKPFYHGGNAPKYLVEGCWTPDNPDAEFPRLSINNVSNNNNYSSTLWHRNGNYIRLKTAQIGYTIPSRITRKGNISNLRIYIEGYNLLTLSGLTKYNIDPESPGVNNGYYPQQRTISLGLKLTL